MCGTIAVVQGVCKMANIVMVSKDTPIGEFISTGKAAEMLGLSVQRVAQLIREHELKAYKIDNGRWLVLNESVRELMRERGL